ncbi:MAG TPA: MaoC family dehydratase [Ilumatobacteraceae bacterium]|nr:MaoC family dehydratase [Ilumatobacteraceae bacterium]
MAGLWLEELEPGYTVHHAVRRTVTEADNTLFSVMTMNPQPLHLDAEFSSHTEYGERLVNSLFTLGLVIGISVYELTLGTTVANLSFDAVEFPAPVFHGDTIHVESQVVAARASRSRPDAGIVTFEHRGYNQHDVLVARCVRNAMMRRRPATVSA